VSHVFANNGESPLAGFCHHVVANDTDRATRFKRGDGTVHSIESALTDSSPFLADVADKKRFGLIAMPSIDDTRDIDIDDVTILQDVVSGDPVADDVVDARTATLGVTQVAKGGRSMPVLKGIVMCQAIDFAGRDTWLDERAEVIHQLGIKAPGGPHSVALKFG
jgi:hypothetical protein